MARPRLLDLFCGAGGCSVGYHRAGFDVVGVDKVDQPNYPFEFIQADALEFCRVHGGEFDAIHASPPCQAHSSITRIKGKAKDHPDLVHATRELLSRFKLWVVENVVGAPLGRGAITLCGSMFDLGVRRHRLFESNIELDAPECQHDKAREKHGRAIAVYGHPGGRSSVCKRERKGSTEQWKKAMGIDWAHALEIAQAIPPAYTEFIGKQLLQHLKGK